MKKATVFFILVLSVCLYKNTSAQLTRTLAYDVEDKSDKYYFKQFYNGTVYSSLKGQILAELNYQMPLKTIAYKDPEGKTLFLGDLSTIDSVVINGFTYIPVKDKFYERLGSMEGKQVLVSYFGKSVPLIASADSSARATVSNNVSDVYLLRMNQQNNRLKYLYSFYVYEGGKLTKFDSVKDLGKVFPSKRTALEDYSKKEKTDFNDIASVEKLLTSIQ